MGYYLYVTKKQRKIKQNKRHYWGLLLKYINIYIFYVCVKKYIKIKYSVEYMYVHMYICIKYICFIHIYICTYIHSTEYFIFICLFFCFSLDVDYFGNLN